MPLQTLFGCTPELECVAMRLRFSATTIIGLVLLTPLQTGRSAHLAPPNVVPCHQYGEQYQPAWHFLNFLPLPQGQGSLRPTSLKALRTGACGSWW